MVKDRTAPAGPRPRVAATINVYNKTCLTYDMKCGSGAAAPASPPPPPSVRRAAREPPVGTLSAATRAGSTRLL